MTEGSGIVHAGLKSLFADSPLLVERNWLLPLLRPLLGQLFNGRGILPLDLLVEQLFIDVSDPNNVLRLVRGESGIRGSLLASSNIRGSSSLNVLIRPLRLLDLLQQLTRPLGRPSADPAP